MNICMQIRVLGQSRDSHCCGRKEKQNETHSVPPCLLSLTPATLGGTNHNCCEQDALGSVTANILQMESKSIDVSRRLHPESRSGHFECYRDFSATSAGQLYCAAPVRTIGKARPYVSLRHSSWRTVAVAVAVSKVSER